VFELEFEPETENKSEEAISNDPKLSKTADVKL
jgi:hypothetical protein